MVDLNVAEEKEKAKDKEQAKEGKGGVGESSKLKRFMGKTPGILKTKLLTVLGNSNEIINGISNKVVYFFRITYICIHLFFIFIFMNMEIVSYF